MIVEFVGLPGAGKSTIAHQLAAVLAAEGKSVHEPTWRLDHELPAGERARRKAALAARATLRAPGRTLRCLRALLASRQPTVADALALTLNWVYLAELERRAPFVGGVHILDQGLLQGLWSVAYRGAAHTAPAVARTLRELLPAGVHVVIVDAPHDVVMRRLARRTGSASRLERDLAAPDGASSIARALSAFDRMETEIRALESEGRVSCLRTQSGGGLRPHAAALDIAQHLEPASDTSGSRRRCTSRPSC